MKHVEDVADIAVRFAKVYNLDVAKVKLAALCHDIGGVMTPQEMYDFAIAKGLNIDPAEKNITPFYIKEFQESWCKKNMVLQILMY